MGQRFLGKVAVVIGGNSGIELAAAKAFANEGAGVAITGVTLFLASDAAGFLAGIDFLVDGEIASF